MSHYLPPQEELDGEESEGGDGGRGGAVRRGVRRSTSLTNVKRVSFSPGQSGSSIFVEDHHSLPQLPSSVGNQAPSLKFAVSPPPLNGPPSLLVPGGRYGPTGKANSGSSVRPTAFATLATEVSPGAGRAPSGLSSPPPQYGAGRATSGSSSTTTPHGHQYGQVPRLPVSQAQSDEVHLDRGSTNSLLPSERYAYTYLVSKS